MNNSAEQPRSLAALLAMMEAQGITDHRRYQMVRQFLNFRAREKNTPINGTFELTPLCNLDCRMCYVHLNREQLCGVELMTTEQWKQIMNQAVDAGMMYATLTGGECLTYPGFRELYLHLRSLGVEVSVLSNGVLLEGAMADFLIANPPARLQITLYGASNEGYARVTGHAQFTRVMANIRRMRDAGIPLSIAVTPNAFMTDGEDIIRTIAGEKLPYRINSGLISPRENTGRELADADLDLYVRLLKLQNRLKNRDDYVPVDENSLPDPEGCGDAACGVRCGAGRSSFSIGWNGIMRPCNTFPGIEASVTELGFRESWRRINTFVNSYPLPIECEGCPYRRVCKHCAAEHASGAPAGHANPAICAWGRRMVAEGISKL